MKEIDRIIYFFLIKTYQLCNIYFDYLHHDYYNTTHFITMSLALKLFSCCCLGILPNSFLELNDELELSQLTLKNKKIKNEFLVKTLK